MFLRLKRSHLCRFLDVAAGVKECSYLFYLFLILILI